MWLLSAIDAHPGLSSGVGAFAAGAVVASEKVQGLVRKMREDLNRAWDQIRAVEHDLWQLRDRVRDLETERPPP
jgi:phage shock protein A